MCNPIKNSLGEGISANRANVGDLVSLVIHVIIKIDNAQPSLRFY